MIELAAASLRASGMLRMRVLGSSMLPAIYPGEVVTVRHAQIAEATPGDVVLFQRDGRFFAHRVIRRRGDAIVTRGDAVDAADPPVGSDEFLGIVACARRNAWHRVAAMIFRRSALAARLYTRVARA